MQNSATFLSLFMMNLESQELISLPAEYLLDSFAYSLEAQNAQAFGDVSP